MGDPKTFEISKPDKKLKCIFCDKSDVNSVEWGALLKLNDVVAHHFCLLFSACLVQTGNDDEGIWAFMPKDIKKEVNRGKRLKCKYCKKSAATIGCNNSSCKVSFHYPCGYKNGCLFQFFNQYASYCPKHKPIQKVPRSTDKMCPICRDSVDNLEEAVWPPCCGKNLFHRACIMNSAKMAGYFFKCPLCNSTSESFIKTMKANGVYIPEQDAAWETEPNAFQELLQSYSQCDADPCLCPHGKDYAYNPENSPSGDREWKIVRCSTCGSSATHKKCSGLIKSAWRCGICEAVVNKLPSGCGDVYENVVVEEGLSDSTSTDSDSTDEEDPDHGKYSSSPPPDYVFDIADDVDSDADDAEIMERLPFINNLFSLEDQEDDEDSDEDYAYTESLEQELPVISSSSSEVSTSGSSETEAPIPASIVIVPDSLIITSVGSDALIQQSVEMLQTDLIPQSVEGPSVGVSDTPIFGNAEVSLSGVSVTPIFGNSEASLSGVSVTPIFGNSEVSLSPSVVLFSPVRDHENAEVSSPSPSRVPLTIVQESNELPRLLVFPIPARAPEQENEEVSNEADSPLKTAELNKIENNTPETEEDINMKHDNENWISKKSEFLEKMLELYQGPLILPSTTVNTPMSGTATCETEPLPGESKFLDLFTTYPDKNRNFRENPWQSAQACSGFRVPHDYHTNTNLLKTNSKNKLPQNTSNLTFGLIRIDTTQMFSGDYSQIDPGTPVVSSSVIKNETLPDASPNFVSPDSGIHDLSG